MLTLHAHEDNSDGRELFSTLTVNKGDILYREGDPARYWYEVVSGIAITCRYLADGHRQLTGFFYQQDVFGVDGDTYLETAEAMSRLVLRRYPVNLLSSQSRAGSEQRDKALHRALECARKSIFLFGHRTAANRLAAFLIAMAERTGTAAGMCLLMTRSDIADHLNLTLHTVSRTICDLARKGLIALDGPQNVRILNLEGLRVLAGEIDAALPMTLAEPATGDPFLAAPAAGVRP